MARANTDTGCSAAIMKGSNIEYTHFSTGTDTAQEIQYCCFKWVRFFHQSTGMYWVILVPPSVWIMSAPAFHSPSANCTC